MPDSIEIHDLWNDPFFRIPNVVIDKHELDPYELATLTVLRRFANGNGRRKAWPSLNKIAELSNASRDRTRRSIGSLVEKGYLTKEKRFDEKGSQTSNVYTLINPFEGMLSQSTPLGSDKAGGMLSQSTPLGSDKAGGMLSQSTPPCFEKAPIKNYLDKELEIKKKEKDIVVEVINHLNASAGTNYKSSTKKTQALIHARLAEGFTKDNFFTVIDKKVKQWKNDKDMSRYLRPETLFSPKFEGYLNEKEGNKANGKVGENYEDDYPGILQF